jgi:glycerol-3-phosphate dehydrogenase subunit B
MRRGARFDVVVIGAGLAGLTAAVRIAEQGARVVVLAKGVGATHLSPTTIDVLGFAPERVERPGEALGLLGAGHPYAKVGAEAVSRALEWLRDRVPEGPLGPYGYEGGLESNWLLPTAVGAVKPSALVPATMAGGDLRGDVRVCAVGFRRHKDFHAALLADNLGRATLPGEVRARAVELDLPASGPADLNSLGLARQFDDPAFRAEVVAQLLPRLGAEERVAFPAVLGIVDPHAVWSELSERLGRPVFEVPTLPPSVPGMRLYATLRSLLQSAGGRVQIHRAVVGAERDGSRVSGVLARGGSRDDRFAGERYVLATGGFASGGLELDATWRARETALGLPVSGVPGPDERRFEPGYFEEHPMARAGVAVDAELRPLAAGGERAADNVLVAGATIAGAAAWREKSGDGISLTTGHRAAELVLAELGAAAASPVGA